MIRALAVVAVVGLICLTVLLLVWTDRRRTARRNQLAAASHDLHRALSVVTAIAAEVRLQETAGYVDWQPINSLISEHRAALSAKDKP